MVDDAFVGRIIGGRYQVQSRVGQGGMATVYKAYDPNLRRVVAVKIIHPHLSESPDFIRRFEDEATVVGQLRHPNIPVVYDFNHDSNGYYIVMEYIDGESLENRLRTLSGTGQRLPVESAARMMIDMCEAVHFAHQHGVIHRDIKPANISIDRQEKVYLMDFGIAKILGGQQHTATGLMVGSAHYMAPEQIQGLSVDARADIYALGVTLFEMLNGKPPFQADSAMTVMMMHLNDPVPDIHALHAEVPQAMAAVIDQAMAKNRTERYQSAAEMAEALRQILEGLKRGTLGAAQAAQARPVEATFIEMAAIPATGVSQAVPPAGTSPTPPPARTPVSVSPASPAETLNPVKTKGNKTWIILLAVVLIVIFAGGGYFLLGDGAEPAPTSAPVVVPPASATPESAVNSPMPPPTATSLPPAALEPTAPGEPTPTLEPTLAAPPTEQPTLTEIPTPNNSGFTGACIDASIWVPYKLQGIEENPSGCWDLAHWGMAADQDRLMIEMTMLNESERSIHRPLTQNAVIRLKVKVAELQTLTNQSGGLAFGVSRPESWQNGGKFIIFRSNAPAPTMQVYLSNGVQSEGAFYQDALSGNEHEIEIRYDQGEITFILDGVEFSPPYALPANVVENPVFSIGYALPAEGIINTEIFDLLVIEE